MFGRRQALASGLCLIAGRAVASQGKPAFRRLDPNDARDFLVISRKMRFRMDDGLVFNWLFGTKYGQFGTELVPLLNMESGSISRVRNVPQGYDVTTLERTFYLDLKQGRPLTHWRNPYTGENIAIGRGPVGPTTVRYLTDGTRVLPDQIGGAKFEGTSVTRLVSVAGDDVWITNDAHVRLDRDGTTGTFEINEWSISHGRLSELSDPDVTAVRAEVNLQEVTNWAAWMKMGTRAGVVTSRGVGRKVLGYDEMREQWRALMAEAHPDIARDPAAAVDRPQNRFEQ